MNGNIAALLDRAAVTWPDKPVLLRDDEALTWRDANAFASALAVHLIEQGVEAGDRVIVEFERPRDVTIALFGALKAGAVVTPLNPRLGGDEKAAISADLAPKAIVRELPSGGRAWPALDLNDQDSAFVLYTSGSSGRPKGVVLSHGATAVALEHWRTSILDAGLGDVVLSALPPAHSLGVFGSILAPLTAGSSVAFLERFSPEAAIAAIADYGVTIYPGVATMFQRILDCDEFGDADFSSLRFVVSGAAPCPWELAVRWRAVTGKRIIRGYGMTELFRPISYSALDERDPPDAIGRAVADVELRIVGEDGKDLDFGMSGELWIKSRARLSEYLHLPEDTQAVLVDGWFRTCDLASIDAEGFVSIKGRIKDMILRGGYTIAPQAIEKVLLSHPAVGEAAVIGVPHEELGEEIAAYVVLKSGGGASPGEIIDYCKERLAAFKYPREIHILDEMPRGPTGKVLKAKLRE